MMKFHVIRFLSNKYILLCIVALGVGIQGRAQDTPPFWKEVQKIIEADVKEPRPRHEILFVGSSSFTMWKDADESFPNKKIVNVGFGGSTLLDQIRYVDYVVFPYQPRQVVIYCGENDLAYDTTITPVETANRFKTLVTQMRNRMPAVWITYVSMKPSPSRAHLVRKYQEGNALIEKYILTIKRASYIDVFTPMLDASGKPLTHIFLADNLHMNKQGYSIWIETIKPYLK